MAYLGRKRNSFNDERDMIITKCVLRGRTCKYMGIFFKLTASHVNYIVKKTISRMAEKFYDRTILDTTQPLAHFRKHKDYILKLLEKENENSSHSPGKDSKHSISR